MIYPEVHLKHASFTPAPVPTQVVPATSSVRDVIVPIPVAGLGIHFVSPFSVLALDPGL